MIYARAFFDLQFQFAETVSAFSGKPLPQTLLDRCRSTGGKFHLVDSHKGLRLAG